MVFSSIEFLFFFLPAIIAAYFLAPHGWRNSILLTGSLFFYLWGGGALVFILLISIATDYFCGLLVRARRGDRFWIRVGVATSASVNLALLAYFKYMNFFIEELNKLIQFFDAGGVSWPTVILPIGISFYTFQSMSYVIDISRGTSEPQRNPVNFALFVAMFPQLIAGPIVRYHEIERSIRKRATNLDDFSKGAIRFAYGLAKKVIIADSLGVIADVAFAAKPDSLTTPTAWLGIFAYTFQIYFDFSAYSDMAIGLGRIFGFRFPENFNRPYSALSVTDFWRRWHITLSNWFRDYLYIPLGGSRAGPYRLYFNLILVFFVTGFWHGANWTFIAWGAFHGSLLIAERICGRKHSGPIPYLALRRGTTFSLVMMGWVLFRANDMSHAAVFFKTMFSFNETTIAPDMLLEMTTRNTITLVVSALVVFLPSSFNCGVLLSEGTASYLIWLRAFLMLALLPAAAMLIASGAFSPFLYFQF